MRVRPSPRAVDVERIEVEDLPAATDNCLLVPELNRDASRHATDCPPGHRDVVRVFNRSHHMLWRILLRLRGPACGKPRKSREPLLVRMKRRPCVHHTTGFQVRKCGDYDVARTVVGARARNDGRDGDRGRRCLQPLPHRIQVARWGARFHRTERQLCVSAPLGLS